MLIPHHIFSFCSQHLFLIIICIVFLTAALEPVTHLHPNSLAATFAQGLFLCLREISASTSSVYSPTSIHVWDTSYHMAGGGGQLAVALSLPQPSYSGGCHGSGLAGVQHRPGTAQQYLGTLLWGQHVVIWKCSSSELFHNFFVQIK